MIYLPIFNFLGYIFFKIPIVYYYLIISISNWWKIRHFSSKSLSWWYIHAYSESCKIIHQVSVQTLVFVYVSVLQNAILRLFISGVSIWTFSALHSFFLLIDFCPTGFFWLKVFNEIVEARPIRFHNDGSSKGECYGNIVMDLPYISCTYWIWNILINTRIFNIY